MSFQRLNPRTELTLNSLEASGFQSSRHDFDYFTKIIAHTSKIAYAKAWSAGLPHAVVAEHRSW